MKVVTYPYIRVILCTLSTRMQPLSRYTSSYAHNTVYRIAICTIISFAALPSNPGPTDNGQVIQAFYVFLWELSVCASELFSGGYHLAVLWNGFISM
jgi:hypothetical protein